MSSVTPVSQAGDDEIAQAKYERALVVDAFFQVLIGMLVCVVACGLIAGFFYI